MINEETRRKLREINLDEAIKGLEVQQADPATIALPFDERMQRLVDYIYQEKYNGKIQRKRQILMRLDTKLPQPFASWSNSL